MGFSITWCAIREENAESFFRRLGLSPTDEIEEIPESLVTTAKLDTGWRIIWYNKYACPFLRPEALETASLDYDIILVLVEEHVMASSSEMWTGGKRRWWISHEGENGPKGLSIEGQPPEFLSAIRKEMEQLQLAEGGDSADVDFIFEIPLKVAESIVGFKHDEKWEHLLNDQFCVMTQTAPKVSLFQRLFGLGR